MKRSMFVLATLVACTDPVDDPFPEDYQSWKSITISGSAPGHGNSVRVIYVNDAAQGERVDGIAPEGSIIVKEIYHLDDAGGRGDLNYIALMRRKGQVTHALADEGGWLFTQTEGPGETENYRALCWNYCHVAAPYNGAFYDYRKL